MNAIETLVLSASDIARCLPADECREGLAAAFRLLASGAIAPPRSLGFDAPEGTFHVKACLLDGTRARFVAKVNGNYPSNPARNGLPTIQGVVVLADAADGRPLAILDTATLTAIRTAAASALAASHLAPAAERALAIVGCGRQGVDHADAFMALSSYSEIRLFDRDSARAESLAARCRERSDARCRVTDSVAEAADGAGSIVTCTSASEYVLGAEHVGAGAFVAAVGTDNPRKREIHPSLIARARVVVDDLDQCASSGDLHHALEAGVVGREAVAGDLAAVVAGNVTVRRQADEIVVFDSTGIALEDVVAADIAHQHALALGFGRRVDLAA